MASDAANVRVVKRSLAIAGHRTSVSLEAAFWRGMRRIAAERGLSVNALAATIERLARPSQSVLGDPGLCAQRRRPMERAPVSRTIRAVSKARFGLDQPARRAALAGPEGTARWRCNPSAPDVPGVWTAGPPSRGRLRISPGGFIRGGLFRRGFFGCGFLSSRFLRGRSFGGGFFRCGLLRRGLLSPRPFRPLSRSACRCSVNPLSRACSARQSSISAARRS